MGCAWSRCSAVRPFVSGAFPGFNSRVILQVLYQMPGQQPTEGQNSFHVVRYTHYIEKRRNACCLVRRHQKNSLQKYFAIALGSTHPPTRVGMARVSNLDGQHFQNVGPSLVNSVSWRSLV